MARELTLSDVMKIDGVVAAVRWRESDVGKAGGGSGPKLTEWLGFETEERARRFVLSAEAIGLPIKGVIQLNLEFRTDFKHNITPMDGFYIHGFKYSMCCTLNRVAVMVDNQVSVDVQKLPGKLVLVRN